MGWSYMKKESIKKHLKAYSVFGKRNSTINHAFASAIAPFDETTAQPKRPIQS